MLTSFAIAVLFLLLTIPLGLLRLSVLARLTVLAGSIAIVVGSALALPQSQQAAVLWSLSAKQVRWMLQPAAAWLLFFGALAAVAAFLSPCRARRPHLWYAGAAVALLGSLGVAGLQEGIAFLIAWEFLSFGGAILLLADRGEAVERSGLANLYMLALLEIGAVALLLCVLLLGASDTQFSTWAASWAQYPNTAFGIAVLFIIGFGAKLGLLPFYEWYPGAYGSGTGASGALLSGIVLNVAFFALGRAILDWLPVASATSTGILLVAVGTVSSILAILYAFQQDDWRRLLSFSTAENAGLAVVALGAASLFRAEGFVALSTLAWTVGLIHLGGHSLAKGSMMLSADRAADVKGDYQIAQSRILALAPWTLGLGAVLGAMSLAAMPPTAGFAGEWYLFQTVFQDFHLHNTAARIALALGGAGLALTAAIALATMIKVFGVGLLGGGEARRRPGGTWPVLLLGLLVLLYAVVLPWSLHWLRFAHWPADPQAVQAMTQGPILIPLRFHFAFISPPLLLLVGLLFALLPVGLIVWGHLRQGRRRVPVWAHGLRQVPAQNAVTALAFANALRVFYSFVYRPTNDLQRQHRGREYFVRELHFNYSEAPFFGPWLFRPVVRLTQILADRIGLALQNGSLNAYLAYIGLLLLVIFASVFYV
ncbi:hydrogenase [Acidithiobacillus sp. CV18-2]|uniref:Hydrogenase n=1 Tax=Igneacidithiobacillus copahuensis TaxID=2724909 RepID=A0AAE3CJG5_9PROT|nr:proton-conducting transporter membrane subunit [Igneacidithiobacillus copahuensis]MBU2755540.1 hydrogenase [Acidithiobacillus sp. CV18-3]MBU2757789.1 hydrogenase [Acidithiobacillus sp. BN09-2]MBU2777946.1 hydrogenase [Acidithiobacillus sp. CV18-2]MBU2797872.1 hydrogenase [Acidithiobacillus sp. VAN18-2]MBU2799282.1 hydrogenase [Acidithiobacillus sp. VAN18-4]UTV80659.1 hydrogenase [Acidithiobacillus sp. YTS05]